MSIKRLLMIALPLLCLLLTQQGLHAQTKIITGRVTDRDGSPIVGASVLVKGSRSGVQTDADGNFSITIPQSARTLVVSSVGFTAREISTSASSFSIVMNPDNAALGEVVVVAYGTRRKADLTGSVTSVTAKEFQKGVINSPEQLLTGKVAGLQITTGGGAAGGGSRIRIRGGASLNSSNDPLVVVDGVPMDGGGIAGSANILNTINPNDIESINVLKDAAATALYGSRASNGVMIITTKKGTSGKPKFNYNTTLSLGQLTDKVDVLTASELRKLIQEEGSPSFLALLGNANTDWQDEIFQDALGWDNNFNVSGSLAKKLPYRFSIGYLNQEGTLKTNEFDRFSTALNLNPKLFDDHLTLNVALKTATTANRFADEGAIGTAVTFDPTQPVYGGKEEFGGYYEWLQSDGFPINLATRNPVALLNLRDNRSNVFRFIGNVQADYKVHFLPDLHVLLNLGVEYNQGRGRDIFDRRSATNYRTNGRVSEYRQMKRNQLADVSLFYTKNLDAIKSKFDVLVGHSYQDFYIKNYSFAAYGQDGLVIPGSEPVFPFDEPRYRLESYLGRINYTLNDKYLLTASIRRDASSKFSPDNRVGYFPAAALAWRMNQEFFRNSNTVSDLKLRLSWGVTGQQDIGDYYSYMPRYTASTPTAQYQFGNAYYSYLRPAGYDPNIKWETTTTSNIGLDYGFFNNRIYGTIDLYQKKTKDLLSTIPVAPGSNFVNELTTNVGNIESKGVEFVLNTVPVRNENLTWDLGFNLTYQDVEITNLLKQQDPNFTGIDVLGIQGGTGNRVGKHVVGHRPYTYFVYKQVYDKTTNKPIEGLYEDLNRDGVINQSDRYLYKQAAPDFLFGFSTQVNYKRFMFGLAGHGTSGNYLYNNVNSERAVFRNVQNPINFVQNTTREYYSTRFFNSQYFSDYFIENASFLRLDNINLGYTVGKVLQGKATMRLGASIQNVFVITKYSGMDPELANDGVDNTIYPRPRIYSLGVNLDF
ncbi:MAG TPA: SusC/RagA family TonB-linked outer membrane protein [Flavihumibacter sp.]